MLRTLFAALAVSAISALTFQPVQAATTLQLDTWISPKHVMNAVVIKTWAAAVEKASNGRVKVKVSWPPKTHPKTMFDRAAKGISDVTWSFHGYTPGRFVLTKVIELPGLGATAEQGSIAYWRVHEKYLAKANEHKGVKLLGLFTHGPGLIHSKKPINSPADLVNKKIRVGGGVMTDIAKALGVVVVSAPATKVYQILQQGVADGVFMPMETKVSLKLFEVADYSLELPDGLYMGSFFLAMNPKRFAGLSKQDQDAIMSVSGETFAAMAGKAWADADVSALKTARAAGNTIKMASTEVQNAFFAKMNRAKMEADWIAAAGKKGVDGAAALAALRAEVAKLKK